MADPVHDYLSGIGTKGGRKGGPARAAKLTPERRAEIASNASLARWAKSKKKTGAKKGKKA
jgi:hypothetical protein